MKNRTRADSIFALSVLLLVFGLVGSTSSCDPDTRDPVKKDETGSEPDSAETGETGDSHGKDTADTVDSEDDTSEPLFLDYRESAWATVYSLGDNERIGVPVAIGDTTGDGVEEVCFQGQYERHCYGFESPMLEGEHEVSEADFKIDLGSVSGWYYLSAPGDLNGDGVDDLSTAPYILFGPFEPLETPKTAELMIDYDIERYSVLSGQLSRGDANGDGKPDLMVAFWRIADDYPLSETHIQLFDDIDGSPLHIDDAVASIEVDDSSKGYTSVRAFGYVGDVNADGFDDIVISEMTTYLVYTPIAGSGEYEGLSLPADIVAGAGDANGDGYADILSTGDSSDNAALLSLFLGPIDHDMSRAEAHASIEVGVDYDHIPGFTNNGDLNGDSLPDLSLSLWQRARARDSLMVYFSPFEGVLDDSDAALVVYSPEIQDIEPTGPIDVNGDGLMDIVYGDSRHNEYVYQGGANWVILGGSF